MKTCLALVLPLILVSGQAQALKCLEPDPLVSFRTAMASPDIYVILRGAFTFGDGLLPGDVTTRGNPNLPQPAPFAADFAGQSLVADGFTQAAAMPVSIQSVCFGPWCGQIASGQDVMAFARTDDQGRLVVDVDPCGTWVFPDPTDTVLEQMRGCTADPASCATP